MAMGGALFRIYAVVKTCQQEDKHVAKVVKIQIVFSYINVDIYNCDYIIIIWFLWMFEIIQRFVSSNKSTISDLIWWKIFEINW